MLGLKSKDLYIFGNSDHEESNPVVILIISTRVPRTILFISENIN